MIRDDLLRLLPDEPRWIDTRGALLGGCCRIVGADAGTGGLPDCLVVSDEFPFAGVVGRPDEERLRELVDASPRIELLAQQDSREWLEARLPDWISEQAILHTLPPAVERSLGLASPRRGDGARGLRLWPAGSTPPLDHLPAELRDELRIVLRRSPVASWCEEGLPVAICCAAVETESWWDVSVQTLEPYRGRGLAGRCFGGLAATMAGRGKRAVWGAHASNRASLRAAAKLEFVEVQRIWTLRAPAGDRSGDPA